MKKLKTILQFDEISGIFIYIPLSVLVLYLSFIYTPLLILYLILMVYLYRRNRILFYYALIIDFLMFIIYLINYLFFTYYDVKNEIKGIIIEKTNTYIILKNKLSYIKVYIKDSSSLEIGRRINIKGYEYIGQERNVKGVFSYYRYKLSKRIRYEYIAKSYEIDKNSFSFYILKGKIIDYFDNNYSEISSMYLKRLILGISTFTEETDELIQNTGIIFLFCISGLHISLLNSILRKFFRFLDLEEELISILLIIIMILYMIIANSSVSIFRAILMSFIKEIISIFKLKISKLDILSISFIIVLMYNPFFIFQTGFYLTYLSTIIIYLSKEKNYVKLSMNIVLFTTPLILYNNHEISIFIILFSIVFSIFFSEFFIPLTYFVALVPISDFIYKEIIYILNEILEVFDYVNLYFNYSITNIYFLLIIYSILFLIFKFNKERIIKIKCISILSLVLFLNYVIPNYSLFPKIEMIDVNQGDSFLLRSGFKTILIDTGESDKYDTTINYLKKNNINNIDYCFISHTDSDHYGEYADINNEINVKNTIINKGDLSYKIGLFRIKTYKYESSNSNDSSMVLYVEILNKKILFSGDIEKEGEKYLLYKGIEDIDILKVPHHGSSSSSSSSFIKKMNPSIALISVGLNNEYGHPDNKVINRYNSLNIEILRSDLDGSIKIELHYLFSFVKKYRNDEIFFIERLDNFSIIF